METVQLTLDDIRHLTTGYDDLSEEKQDEIITKLCKTLRRQYTPFPLIKNLDIFQWRAMLSLCW